MNQPKQYTDWLPRETLGQRIHRMRLERKMTCRDVAAFGKVSAPTVSRIERGEDASISVLFALAEAFSIGPEAIVSGVDGSKLGQFTRPDSRRNETDLLMTQE